MNLNTEYIDLQNFKITGTSTDIYKPYLRLTSAPEPNQVRTFETLKKTLIALKKKWNNGVKDVDAYRFVCDQFKSLRQDLTVQGVRDEFTVEVYEVHCRIALDAGDHEEFNQCKSQLGQLYMGGICSSHRIHCILPSNVSAHVHHVGLSALSWGPRTPVVLVCALVHKLLFL